VVQDLRRRGKACRTLAALVNTPRLEVSKETPRSLEIWKLRRIERDKTDARGIHRDRVAAHREHSVGARAAHDRSVAFHADGTGHGRGRERREERAPVRPRGWTRHR
jgi:hypothetical protein